MRFKVRAGESGGNRQFVPADAMLGVEFETLGTPREERARIRGNYEYQLGCLMDLSKTELGRRNPASVAEAELYPVLSRVFNSAFTVDYDDDACLSEALEKRTHNCRSATAILGDALTLFGKPAGIIVAPQHVLLTGSELCFETAAPPDECTFDKNLLRKRYKAWQEADLGALLALAYNWRGTVLCGMGRHEEEVAAYKKALEILPGYIQAMENMGVALGALHRFDESRAVFKEAARISPLDSRVSRGENHVIMRQLALLDERKNFDANSKCVEPGGSRHRRARANP